MADQSTYETIRQQATAHGQEQLFDHWQTLNADQQASLLGQIQRIDFELVDRQLQSAQHGDDWSKLAQRAEPPQGVRLDGSGSQFTSAAAQAAGEQALRSGEVGAILVAGGQGTRLGFDHPKGMYEIGPVSKASLFQILFEKLVAVGRRYGKPIPLYLMTSDATHAETETYLREKQFFGMPPANVKLFCQGVMPAVDANSGKILLSQPDEVALSPDGHGGMLAALKRSGGLDDLARRGIKHLFYFQVDNPLARMCDPVFIGHHLLAKSELSTLAVAKREPLERVGNIVAIDGRTRIIEYSDLPSDVAEQRSGDGSLRLWAGNTAVHVLATEFLNRAAGNPNALPFHVAKKKVACVNSEGVVVEPKEPNAIKFERFIFDLLPLADRALVVEADAARTFAPVKNARGEQKDSPETCQAAMMALYGEWLTAAGANVSPGVAVEISPLFALDAGELAAKIAAGTVFNRPTYLQ